MGRVESSIAQYTMSRLLHHDAGLQIRLRFAPGLATPIRVLGSRWLVDDEAVWLMQKWQYIQPNGMGHD